MPKLGIFVPNLGIYQNWHGLMINIKMQAPDQVVEISKWLHSDEEYSVYPEGAREKNRIICPNISIQIEKSFPNINPSEIFDFCIPEHPYLFKRSRKAYPEEFWMEIFAYQLGCLVNIQVPPSFVAINTKTGEAGALVEWFYDSETETFKRGGDFLVSYHPGFQRKKGRDHNFQSIYEILSDGKQNLAEDWLTDFVKIVLFDALTGNTDRHQENWGIIYNFETSKGRVAPAFDNGDSMGREILENNFTKYDQSLDLKKYLMNGRPHLKWTLTEDHDKRGNHEQLIQNILGEFPNLREPMLKCLQFSEERVKGILENLTQFNVPVRLTRKRAEFMLKLLKARKERLNAILNGDVNELH